MGKRRKLILGLCVFMMIGGSASTVQAATIKSPYMAEQAIGKAPNVKVYLTGSKMSAESEAAGTLGDIELSRNGDIQLFSDSDEGIHYIILLDNSGSVEKEQFEEARNQIAGMRKSLGEQDQMELYTVGSDSPAGEKKNVLGRIAKGSEKKKKNKDIDKISHVEYMGTAESMTVLYRSLNEVLAEQASPDMRTVVLLVTDGEDDSKGKDIDKVSTVEEVKNASVPVYGVLLHRRSGKADEKVDYTRNQILAEKNCRGYYYDCSVDPSGKSVKKAFQTIDTILKQETYIVNLRAATNRTAGRESLRMTVDNSALAPVLVDYSDYERDGEAPKIEGGIEQSSPNAITFLLQDQNGLNTADIGDKSHYAVQARKGGGDGKIWVIESVSTEKSGEGTLVTLTMAEDLYNGDYTLKCSGIRDSSQDENIMNDTVEFSVENGASAGAAAVKNALKSYWWIALLALVAVIGGIIIRTVRKKAVKVVEVNPDELAKADTRLIRLTITDRAGVIKDVEWNVEGSLFVGRSDICNIFFDDDRLSKQHFVIEVNKMGCYIEDLESTNGTFVNGVKLTNRRMLLDGDVITAGREKIVFHVPKNQEAAAPEEVM